MLVDYEFRIKLFKLILIFNEISSIKYSFLKSKTN